MVLEENTSLCKLIYPIVNFPVYRKLGVCLK